MNAGSGSGGNANGTNMSAGKRKASELPLPTPPSLASKGNPNIGIEFHLNDANPHVLARSILFLVSSYMSSAVMNQAMAINTAANFGITLPPNSVHLQHPNSSQSASPSAASPSSNSPSPLTPIPLLSSYSHWTPSDHWSYLLSIYGCFQLPRPFLRRMRETLELLIRLTGSATIAADRAAGRDPSILTQLSTADAAAFSQHPYTFFLHLPSLTLAVLLPIWKSWEDAISKMISATLEESASYTLPTVDPIFTPTDLRVAHPDDPYLCDALSTFYTHGSISFQPGHFPATHAMRSREEWIKIASIATAQAATATTTNSDNSIGGVPTRKPVGVSGSSELYPPSLEEYGNINEHLLNPTLLPLNFAANSAFHNPAFAPAASVASMGLGGGFGSNLSSASSCVTAKRVADETNLPWLFVREPFSMLIPKLSKIELKKDAPVASKEDGAPSTSPPVTPVIAACLDLMSKMSHALFWVVGFQQSQLQPSYGANTMPTKQPSKVPYVRLYFYNHDQYFHLHTYDFLYDRILVYHLAEGVGMQSLILLARHRMKNQDSLLEANMNFPVCWRFGEASTATKDGKESKDTPLASVDARPTSIDLRQFCLLSLNSNLKLVRNIFGWDLASYTYPTQSIVLRFSVCDYNLDLSAPTPQPSANSASDVDPFSLPGSQTDGFRIVHDWLMTSVQPILLHDSVTHLPEALLTEVTRTAPRSSANLRTFCLLVGLLIKQGHLDQKASRRRLVQLFAMLLQPNSPFQMDHLFTSLITHIGLLKAELLPLMYLLLTPLEETLPEVMGHNTLFFKGLWQLELVSMKFEVLINGAWQNQVAKQRKEWLKIRSATSAPTSTGAPSTPGADESSASNLPWDPTCRLCLATGPSHPHHSSHGQQLSTSIPKDALLSLLFITDPKYCPQPISSSSATSASTSPSPSIPPHSTTPPTVGPSGPFIPGSVSPDSPLSWLNLRGIEFQQFLHSCGRSVQLFDIVDFDWSSGIVTGWMNRTYVNYVRKKCSQYAQVCVIDFETLTVLTPPRSVVHLKTMRSMNIR